MAKLLIVDDEPNLRAMLAMFFEKRGYSVDLAASGTEALDMLKQSGYDIVISDVRMPGLDGMALLEQIKQGDQSQPPVILITAYGSENQSFDAIRQGAADYIKKPFDMEELLFRVHKVMDKASLEKKVYDLEEELSERYTFGNIVGKSSAIQKIITLVKQVAHLNTTILITGESGVGKEVIAKAIHYNGPRKRNRFVSINCGALPETLLESELFGYVKGAFTGAERDRDGLFQEANHGTIFLDEIGEMSPSMQVKLLNVLQDKKVRAVGSRKELDVDVRIIAATNRDLSDAVSTGDFREDLYYRINVIHLDIPPLRKRPDDIPILVQHFIASMCQEQKTDPKPITSEAMKILEQYSWPGNVRELENVIERTLALEAGNTITKASLPDHLRKKPESQGVRVELPGEGADLRMIQDDITTQLIQQAMERTKGNQKKAAKLLKISPRSLRYLLSKFEITRDE